MTCASWIMRDIFANCVCSARAELAGLAGPAARAAGSNGVQAANCKRERQQKIAQIRKKYDFQGEFAHQNAK